MLAQPAAVPPPPRLRPGPPPLRDRWARSAGRSGLQQRTNRPPGIEDGTAPCDASSSRPGKPGRQSRPRTVPQPMSGANRNVSWFAGLVERDAVFLVQGGIQVEHLMEIGQRVLVGLAHKAGFDQIEN